MPTKTPKPIGEVTHFYDKISVGIIKLKASLKLGEILHFKGRKADFVQPITSMQLNHKPIQKAGRGKVIGVHVNQKVEEGDLVYRVAAKK